jgi:IMP dehydrogenase
MHQYKISGVPITDPQGRWWASSPTATCASPAGRLRRSVSDYMVSDGLVTARWAPRSPRRRSILHRHRIEKLPLVDDAGFLRGLITYKDILKKQDFPNATSDVAGGCWWPPPSAWATLGMRRAEAVSPQGVDAVAIDTAHGHSKGVVETIGRAAPSLAETPILAGNVVTP